MPGGRCERFDELPGELFRVVDYARRAAFSTTSADGTIATVPVCFALSGEKVVVAVDDKPKTTTELARVRNIRRDPRVTVLFDRWDEDWTRLAWVMVKGVAMIAPQADTLALLERYPQYRSRPPEGPFLMIEPQRISWWSWA